MGREVPVPIAANCVPLYQAGKCACRDLSIYKLNLSDLITPTESYGRFEPGGILDVAILAQSKCKAPKFILPLRNGVV